jgi:hypothetical protein
MNPTTGQMPEQSSSQPGRSAVVGMAVAGIAGGGLLLWFTGDRFFNSNASEAAIVTQHTLFAVALGVGLWLTRSRLWRSFAIGLTLCWMLFLVPFGLTGGFTDDPNSGPGGSPRLPVATNG